MSDSSTSVHQRSHSLSESDIDPSDQDESSLDLQSVSIPSFPSTVDLHLDSSNRNVSILDPRRMMDSTKHCEIGESNKLLGLRNYNVWKIKMEAIFKREKLWGIVETKRLVSVFPITIDGIVYTFKERFISEKQCARSSLILSVLDNLIGIVVGKEDPADSWDILHRMYNAGN